MLLNYSNSIFAEFKKIYGINRSSSLKMCKHIRVLPLVDSKLLNPTKKRKALNFIKKTTKIEFDLKDFEIQRFVHLYTIKHLKSLKHKFFLPINGQRNCTNGSTAKREAPKLRGLIYKYLKKKKSSKRSKK